MKKTGWIIVAVIVVLVLWLFSGYNGLVSSQEVNLPPSLPMYRLSISVVPT